MVLAGRTWFPGIGPWFESDLAVYFFSWGGMLFDLFIVPALLWKRTRALAYAASVVFHLLNATMFHIGVFPWFMLAATLVFFPPQFYRGLLRSLEASTAGYSTPGPRKQIIIASILGVFVLVHLIVPLRCHILQTQPSWSERGHLFAWHMKLRGKECAMRIIATDPITGKRNSVDPRHWLTTHQASRMMRDPVMIHDFVRFISSKSVSETPLEIRVIVLCSLNGRKPQLLIDPTVDLAHTERPTGTPPYVMPLVEPLRKHHWDEPKQLWVNYIPEDLRQEIRGAIPAAVAQHR